MKWWHAQLKKWMFLLIFFVAFIARLIGNTTVPSTPYWEEAALGYDAYSLLRTGRDHHGNWLPLTAFESFGDYKPSLYFYATVPGVALFGLNTFAVRLPAAVASALSVTLLAWLAQRWLSRRIGIWTALLATLQPWSWHVGRLGFEVNLSVTLLLLGLFFVELSVEQKHGWKKWLWPVLSAASFSGAMYSYHAARLLAPLMAAAAVLLRENWTTKTFTTRFPRWGGAAVAAALITLPLLAALQSPVIQQRFKETSPLASTELAEAANLAKTQAGNTLFARVFFHTRIFQARDSVSRYLSHFSPRFLFLRGDINPRHSSQYLGLLYPWEFFTLIAGFIGIATRIKHRRVLWQLIVLTLLAPLAASFTYATPHALRALPLASFLSIWSAVGVVTLTDELRSWRASWHPRRFLLPALSGLWFLILLTSFAALAYYMATQYGPCTALEWQKGYPEIIQALRRHQQPGETLHISRAYGRPAMYVWFFEKTDPKKVQAASQTAKRDQGELLEFEEWTFFDGQWLGGGVAAAALESVPENRTILEKIPLGNGERTWAVYR